MTDRAAVRAANRTAMRAAELGATRPSMPGARPAAARDEAERTGDHSARAAARPRRGFFLWRHANRRITVEARSPFVWVGDRLAGLARRLLVVGKVLAALAALAGAIALGRVAVMHVVASPRFSVRELRIGATSHVTREDLVDRTGVQLGDALLALDTDVVAARVARHPWIAEARVRRELPGTLVVDVTERRAAALGVIGGLYLLDHQGHPFKRATLDEADGHVVLTGISRREYAALPRAAEAAFREALSLLAAYQQPDSLATARRGASAGARPPLSEIHIDPRAGFSLFLYEGGGEIRLGRGDIVEKLARLDEILSAVAQRGTSALRVVHLDGPAGAGAGAGAGDRVPVRFATTDPPPDPGPRSTVSTVAPPRRGGEPRAINTTRVSRPGSPRPPTDPPPAKKSTRF